ncbi:MAG: hypothetical protein ACLFQM_12340 [Fidelibacterota bacterium]
MMQQQDTQEGSVRILTESEIADFVCISNLWKISQSITFQMVADLCNGVLGHMNQPLQRSLTICKVCKAIPLFQHQPIPFQMIKALS